jgi:hypothetical protein
MMRFNTGDFISCKRFFADNTFEIDYGYVMKTNAHTAVIRFGDGSTESHYFSAIRHA